MGRNYEIVDNFLVAYTQNNPDSLTELLADDIQIHYSTIGSHSGKENVLKALAWNTEYDVRTVTVTNLMSYTDNQTVTVALIAHHLIANEEGPTLYPLCFGGKYVFTLNESLTKILKVAYAQEYQVENTLFIRNWKLAKRISDLSAVSDFDMEKAYPEILSQNSSSDVAIGLAKLFFWALDSQDERMLRTLSDENIHIKRLKTMSFGCFESTGIEHLHDFITQSKQYYSMDQYSLTFRDVEETEDSVIVHASHLIPYRLGTKKLNVNTKYHSFYDEDIDITFSKKGASYAITDINMRKIVDMQYNGFDILHL